MYGEEWRRGGDTCFGGDLGGLVRVATRLTQESAWSARHDVTVRTGSARDVNSQQNRHAMVKINGGQNQDVSSLI
jgi:hypothetical protein